MIVGLSDRSAEKVVRRLLLLIAGRRDRQTGHTDERNETAARRVSAPLRQLSNSRRLLLRLAGSNA